MSYPKHSVNDIEALKNALHYPMWGFDIETNSKDPPYGDDKVILTAALAPTDDTVFGFILDHPLDQNVTNAEYTERVNAIQLVLGDPKKRVTGHNVHNFDRLWWEIIFDREVRAEIIDSKILHSLIDENAENTLEWLARVYTPFRKNEAGVNAKRLAFTDPSVVLEYNMEDARISRYLYDVLWGMILDRGLA